MAGGRCLFAPGTFMNRTFLDRASAVFGFLVFGLAIWAIQRSLAKVRLEEIWAHLAGLPPTTLALALGLTILSYLILTGYDATALAHVGRRLPYRQVALTSFISYAVANNLGLAMLTGGSIRLRIYSGAGLGAAEIGTVVFLCTLTFGIGASVVGGLVLLLEPQMALAAIALPPGALRAIGAALLIATGAYVIWTLKRDAPIRVRDFTVALPSARFTLVQVLLAAADLASAGAILWILLPAGVDIGYWAFLAIYILAAVAALLSHVPGGIGVFESVVLLFIGTTENTGAVLGSLIAYRAFYYLLPLLVASILLGIYELRRRGTPRSRPKEASGSSGDKT